MFRKNEGERGKVRFEGSTPIPNVKNLSASLDYYIGILGFNKDWVDGDPPEMASVSRDKADIMLCQNAQGQPGIWIWVGVSDAELLFEEYKAHGAAILQEPMNYSWESDWILPYLRVSRNVANRICSRSSVALL